IGGVRGPPRRGGAGPQPPRGPPHGRRGPEAQGYRRGRHSVGRASRAQTRRRAASGGAAPDRPARPPSLAPGAASSSVCLRSRRCRWITAAFASPRWGAIRGPARLRRQTPRLEMMAVLLLVVAALFVGTTV